MLPNRGFRSETSIQQKNVSSIRNGLYVNKNPYIEALCQSFKLSPAKYVKSYNKANIIDWIQVDEAKNQQDFVKKCKKCEKIRNTVKDFFRAKFETADSDRKNKTELSHQPNRIRMHIVKENSNHHAVFDSPPIVETADTADKTICFGCDEPKREPNIRGPPIISPVCKNEGQVNAAPLGEVVKNNPERIKKIIKIDRPRSVGPRKRVLDKDENKETSINEMKKHQSH